MRQGKPQYRPDSFGKIVRLESSFETKFADLLDELKIKWIRPKPLPWIDDLGTEHNYYPDFYLINYNIYFDPKNDYLINSFFVLIAFFCFGILIVYHRCRYFLFANQIKYQIYNKK